jgi:hypothetical protein
MLEIAYRLKTNISLMEGRLSQSDGPQQISRFTPERLGPKQSRLNSQLHYDCLCNIQCTVCTARNIPNMYFIKYQTAYIPE